MTSKEALEELVGYLDNVKKYIVKERVATIEKELKTLEIIKKHYVDLDLVRCSENYEQYNSHYETNKYYLTEEEYDLLKEVLL